MSATNGSLLDGYDIDLSPDQRRLLVQLKELFPTNDTLDLSLSILNHPHASIDQLMELVLGEVQESPEYPLDVYKLLEVFPDVSLTELNQAYVDAGNDFESASVKLVEKLNLVSPEPDEAHVMAQILHTTPERFKLYLNRHNTGTRALIDFVIHEISLKPPKSGSKVQRSLSKGLYLYDDISPEAKQLEELCEMEEFKALDKLFLQKLLVATKGDISQLIDTVSRILLDHLQEHTFPQGKLPPKKVMNISTISPKLKSSTLLVPAAGWNAVEAKKKAQRPVTGTCSYIPQKSNRNIENRIDLHGMQVAQAVQIAGRSLREWWDVELAERVHEGRFENYGSKAHFVDLLDLISGRGIHSVGGYLKIKVSLRNYLDNNKYIYTENTWGYTVHGKGK